jgi:hypothetical protein
MAKFSHEPGFCPRCGTILPMLGSEGDVRCYNCKQTFGPEGKEVTVRFRNVFRFEALLSLRFGTRFISRLLHAFKGALM